MNFITRFIHNIVIGTKAEEFLVWMRRESSVVRKIVPVQLRSKFPSVGRFIPQASEYAKTDSYSLTRDNTHFTINRSDYVQWRLFYGVRDNALLAAKKYLEEGSIVLDIGSNFGAFSLRLATYAKEKSIQIKIHGFEPNPTVFDRYRSNLALNHEIIRMIDIHPAGLGNKTGEQSFSFTASNTGAGRVVSGDHELKVRIQRLDDFIQKIRPAKIAFIKLIAEGFEPEILKGGWNTIEKFKPPLFIEVTRTWWRENNAVVEDVLDQLQSLGYSFMIEHFNEMIPYEPEKHASRFQFNLLATIGN